MGTVFLEQREVEVWTRGEPLKRSKIRVPMVVPSIGDMHETGNPVLYGCVNDAKTQ
jgi:hypothetical protein